MKIVENKNDGFSLPYSINLILGQLYYIVTDTVINDKKKVLKQDPDAIKSGH